MKFKHADQRSMKRLCTRPSFARLGCIMGCVLITFLGNIKTVLNGMPSRDATHCAGLSQAADAGPINFTDDDNLLPTEAFLSSEQKYNPFLMLLCLRELCDSSASMWIRPSVTWPQAMGRGRLYQEPSRTSLTRFLHSAQLLC